MIKKSDENLHKKTAPLARSCKYSIYPTINVWRTVEHDEQLCKL